MESMKAGEDDTRESLEHSNVDLMINSGMSGEQVTRDLQKRFPAFAQATKSVASAISEFSYMIGLMNDCTTLSPHVLSWMG